ncbi:MAG: NAD(P) transhydrogenase subunit alpha [Treponema sp.]|jgi:NAD(P) transhydrogenase subunit alpha|uniref:proton-translocating NAD(P)(+) transhydrogenase n=1 Tax=Treponema ruminis TaxID=744515 RepID=A0A7W8G769_9SPIR|nr:MULTISPECIES: NAD(P) transhydrogenase subunit alpha [Treponema]MBB5225070.1 NAD(P) transhydrogenase subunit alpha [Treponema ruminis]MBQ9623396.1 NAD(P) transhydrogenase subunit alpha [Treponema sp.]MBR0101128.1 NAD(P) transhydrogenase subunit alpha [Treponema sp.]MBR0494791.1 NAD(P) transhydrogenase subunit alpha [Treponema sp.]QSI00990.1 NAD(P) transhydrogenase subunit alpha [Treponema ruminis]
MKKVLVCKEKDERETRVALIPDDIKKLVSMGFEFKVVSGAGLKSGFSDEAYKTAGASIVAKEEDAYDDSEIIVRIMKPESIDGIKKDTLHLSYMDPFNEKELLNKFAAQGIQAVSLEMIPRSTLAQKMDVQSSQTSLAGYVAVVNAAAKLPKILPMMVTPAGTINPARVFIIGVGVAGLQAIATAKRLGARVDAFDTRPVVEEQVKSLGASFVKIDLGEMGQTAQGYAKELTPEQIAKQKEAQAKVCEKANIVITTAKVFGRKAPRLIEKNVLDRMMPGSIVVDMACSTGGNVEGSKLFENVVTENGVTIMSGDLLERQVPYDASKMFSGNITAFLTHAGFYNKEAKEFNVNMEDDIMKGCLLTQGGQIIHERFKA